MLLLIDGVGVYLVLFKAKKCGFFLLVETCIHLDECVFVTLKLSFTLLDVVNRYSIHRMVSRYYGSFSLFASFKGVHNHGLHIGNGASFQYFSLNFRFGLNQFYLFCKFFSILLILHF